MSYRIAILLLFLTGTVVAQDPNFAAEFTQPAAPIVSQPALPITTAPAEGTPNLAPAAPQIPTKSVLQMVRDGGIAMLPIGLASVFLFVFVFERVISLRRGRVVPRPFVKRFLEQLGEGNLEREQAVKLCEENGSPIARVFAAAAKKWNRPSVEIDQAIIDEGERVTTDLRRHIRVFNAISTISPLLGLMGTVFGMIQSFNALVVAGSGGRHELRAKGIAESLLSTAAGLCVAVPALVFYWYFQGQVESLLVEIDGHCQKVVNLIASDGWRVDGESPTKTKRKTKQTPPPAAAAA